MLEGKDWKSPIIIGVAIELNCLIIPVIVDSCVWYISLKSQSALVGCRYTPEIRRSFDLIVVVKSS